ncbi:OsmC family protein [Brevibacterium atlanticum]|uniref:OsmC family protein n=1 Tax=Brevibacterium atlanticum TaxID=2697563 RepID=UPI00141FABFA|nr:OsmC family protein [Brevibacterium atlanticum]
MTATTDIATAATTTVPISAQDRAARLTAAGQGRGERIAASAKNAQLTFTAKGHAEGSVSSVIKAGKHTFTVDEPTPLGGDDAAPNPVEYVLGALISCQVVVYRLYAHNLGLTIDDLEITAEGDLDVQGIFGIDEDVRPGFSAVRISVKVTGPDSEEAYQELQHTVDAHCPVFDIVSQPTPIDVTVTKAN